MSISKFTDEELIKFYNSKYNISNKDMAVIFGVSKTAIQSRRQKLGLVAKNNPPKFTKKLNKIELNQNYEKDRDNAIKKLRVKGHCSPRKGEPGYEHFAEVINKYYLKNKEKIVIQARERYKKKYGS